MPKLNHCTIGRRNIVQSGHPAFYVHRQCYGFKCSDRTYIGLVPRANPYIHTICAFTAATSGALVCTMVCMYVHSKLMLQKSKIFLVEKHTVPLAMVLVVTTLLL
jgi:hypothetical protein